MQTCETHTYSRIQEYAYDPTRTTVLRNAFAREMRRRINQLMDIIRTAIIDQDCFGLLPTMYAELNAPNRRAFAFPRTAEKVEAFMKWLQQQEDRGLLETRTYLQVSEAIESAWTNKFIYDSYKRGVMRARSELRNRGYDVPTIEQSGGIEEVMRIPFHIDTVGVLFTRAFTELKGITAAMDNQISKVLSQGLIDGDNPRLLTRKLVATINGKGIGDLGIRDILGRYIPADRRAEMLARTEIIRAHHRANIQEYKSWGAGRVEIIAELWTAEDNRVCDVCASLHGEKFILADIENRIPVHPLCRCIAIPVERRKEHILHED